MSRSVCCGVGVRWNTRQSPDLASDDQRPRKVTGAPLEVGKDLISIFPSYELGTRQKELIEIYGPLHRLSAIGLGLARSALMEERIAQQLLGSLPLLLVIPAEMLAGNVNNTKQHFLGYVVALHHETDNRFVYHFVERRRGATLFVTPHVSSAIFEV
jgi:hypothetical protein